MVQRKQFRHVILRFVDVYSMSIQSMHLLGFDYCNAKCKTQVSSRIVSSYCIWLSRTHNANCIWIHIVSEKL